MRRSVSIKFGALGSAVALAGSLAVVASGTTGAYFSDTNSGTIGGTIGNVQVTTTGGVGSDKMNVAFTNMAPGAPQTVTIAFKNTGTLAQDISLEFPNVQALHAINNLGSFGEVHVKAGDVSIFDSANLQDGRTTASGNSCGKLDPSGCWPLPSELKVASDLAPGANGTVSFTFNYAAKLGDVNPEKGYPALSGGGVFNSYPLTEQAFGIDAEGNPGVGLPISIVATQTHK